TALRSVPHSPLNPMFCVGAPDSELRKGYHPYTTGHYPGVLPRLALFWFEGLDLTHWLIAGDVSTIALAHLVVGRVERLVQPGLEVIPPHHSQRVQRSLLQGVIVEVSNSLGEP